MTLLTKNEQEIMELLWKVERPLSRSEIINMSPSKSWKDSSIHILLNSLLEKEFIEVSGFCKTGKNFGRTYSPIISQEEYFIYEIKQNKFFSSNRNSIDLIFSTLIQSFDIDEQTIERLEAMLAERKNK